MALVAAEDTSIDTGLAEVKVTPVTDAAVIVLVGYDAVAVVAIDRED